MAAMLRLVAFAFTIAATGSLAEGPVYRCANAGSVSFQQVPCPTASEERAYELPSYPPVNMLERDRLLAREAALDARLVRRAEIDAQERIAREARWARQAEAEAERERARTAEGGYFYPAFPAMPARVTHYRNRAPTLNDVVMGGAGLQRIR
jgi:hypothetical protein